MKIIESTGYTKLERPRNILGNKMGKPGKSIYNSEDGSQM